MRTDGIEIERKYRLRTTPSAEVLQEHGAEALEIEQTYLRLIPGVDARRVRRIRHGDGRVEHVLTEKAGIGRGTLARREHERALDQAEYEALLDEADPDLRPVRKTRHVVPHGAQRLEIDVFHAPPGLVVVEVELASEEEPVVLPDWIGPWIEVTDDPRYLNVRLAARGSQVPTWPAPGSTAGRVSGGDL
jgi:CYTH domain-containing protein